MESLPNQETWVLKFQKVNGLLFQTLMIGGQKINLKCVLKILMIRLILYIISQISSTIIQNPIYKKKKHVGRKLRKPILNDLLNSEIKLGNAIGNSSVIVRKDILDRVGGISENKNLVASEDFNTWLRIAQITNQFKYLNITLGYYLVHDNSAQRRDLSIPHREAVIQFMNLYDNKQKLNLEAKLKYMSGSYNALNNNYTKAKEDFIFVLKNGNINLRLRSLLKTILIIFK